MKGLKKYSHEDRGKIIQEMIPLIRQKFGDNLVALASQGSYARGEDFDYSDLELIAFLKEMPKGKSMAGMGKIRNGILVELIWTTKEAYIADVKEVTEDWHIAGSDKLLPIINSKFVEELNNYKVQNLREKCLKQAVKHWHEVQESTAKVLNAISQKNQDGLPLLVFDMLRHMLISLSFLNQKPYVTFSRFISEARTFNLKPNSFNKLAGVVVEGKYQQATNRFRELIEKTFSEFENIFDALELQLYDDNVDPSIGKEW